MKRNPRWMMAVILMMLAMSCLPGQALAQSGPFRLPEGGDTIGDPDMPGGSRSLQSGRNMRAPEFPLIVQIAGTYVVVRFQIAGLHVRVTRRAEAPSRIGNR